MKPCPPNSFFSLLSLKRGDLIGGMFLKPLIKQKVRATGWDEALSLFYMLDYRDVVFSRWGYSKHLWWKKEYSERFLVFLFKKCGTYLKSSLIFMDGLFILLVLFGFLHLEVEVKEKWRGGSNRKLHFILVNKANDLLRYFSNIHQRFYNTWLLVG